MHCFTSNTHLFQGEFMLQINGLLSARGKQVQVLKGKGIPSVAAETIALYRGGAQGKAEGLQVPAEPGSATAPSRGPVALPPASADCREEAAARAPAQPRAAAVCGAPSRPPSAMAGLVVSGAQVSVRVPPRTAPPAAGAFPPRPSISAGGRLLPLGTPAEASPPPVRPCGSSERRVLRVEPVAIVLLLGPAQGAVCLLTGSLGAGGSRSVPVAAPAGPPGAKG